jgi:hypothetical protein
LKRFAKATVQKGTCGCQLPGWIVDSRHDPTEHLTDSARKACGELSCFQGLA